MEPDEYINVHDELSFARLREGKTFSKQIAESFSINEEI